MGIYLNQNNIMFSKDINSDIYVDKTLLIEQTNKYINTNSQYVCIGAIYTVYAGKPVHLTKQT